MEMEEEEDDDDDEKLKADCDSEGAVSVAGGYRGRKRKRHSDADAEDEGEDKPPQRKKRRTESPPYASDCVSEMTVCFDLSCLFLCVSLLCVCRNLWLDERDDDHVMLRLHFQKINLPENV
jgi:hypothetical protein